MNIVSAIVLFAVIWFMVLFILLPIGLKTQGDVGERTAGTQAGAPATGFSMKRKVWTTTFVAIAVWIVVASIIVWGGFSLADFERLGPSG